MSAVDDAIERAENDEEYTVSPTEPRTYSQVLFDDRLALAAEVKRLRTTVEWALGDAWDDGNATGLDGWVGPGRGTEPDDYAIRERQRYIEKKTAAVTSGDEVQS